MTPLKRRVHSASDRFLPVATPANATLSCFGLVREPPHHCRLPRCCRYSTVCYRHPVQGAWRNQVAVLLFVRGEHGRAPRIMAAQRRGVQWRFRYGAANQLLRVGSRFLPIAGCSAYTTAAARRTFLHATFLLRINIMPLYSWFVLCCRAVLDAASIDNAAEHVACRRTCFLRFFLICWFFCGACVIVRWRSIATTCSACSVFLFCWLGGAVRTLCLLRSTTDVLNRWRIAGSWWKALLPPCILSCYHGSFRTRGARKQKRWLFHRRHYYPRAACYVARRPYPSSLPLAVFAKRLGLRWRVLLFRLTPPSICLVRSTFLRGLDQTLCRKNKTLCSATSCLLPYLFCCLAVRLVLVLPSLLLSLVLVLVVLPQLPFTWHFHRLPFCAFMGSSSLPSCCVCGRRRRRWQMLTSRSGGSRLAVC